MILQYRMKFKKPICPWLFDFNLTKTSIHKFLMWWKFKKNKAKEELENILRHIEAIREEERVYMDTMREEESVCIEQNAIIFFSDDEYD